jgi:hypothetical protein
MKPLAAAVTSVQRHNPEEEELQMMPLAAMVTPVQRKTFQKSMVQREGVHGPRRRGGGERRPADPNSAGRRQAAG